MTSTREQQPAHDTPAVVSFGLPVRALEGSDLFVGVPNSLASNPVGNRVERNVSAYHARHGGWNTSVPPLLLNWQRAREILRLLSCERGEHLTAAGS